jgi:hypothetical protein
MNMFRQRASNVASHQRRDQAKPHRQRRGCSGDEQAVLEQGQVHSGLRGQAKRDPALALKRSARRAKASSPLRSAGALHMLRQS